MVYMFYKLSFAEWKEQLGYTDEEQAKADWQEWYGEDAKYIYEAVMQNDCTSAICGVETFAGTYNASGLGRDLEISQKEQNLEGNFSEFD